MKRVFVGPRSAASLFVAIVSGAACATPTVSVVVSLRVDDARTTALGVNASGQMVGTRAYTTTVTGKDKKSHPVEGWEAFITDADGSGPADVLPLTGTGLATAAGPCHGLALSDALVAINASGESVGCSAVSVTVGTKTMIVEHAVLDSGGTLTDLGALGTAPATSTATGINADGIVVGTSDLGIGRRHAFLFDGTALTDLGTLGGKSSEATGISDSGIVVGGSTLSTGVSHPFSYSSGTMTDLGLPTSFSSARATAISTGGIVVGTGEPTPVGTGKKKGPPPATQSFLLQGTTFTNLGSLYKDKKGNATAVLATGVNADGTVVGDTFDANGKPRAFVYSGGMLSDLTTLLPSAYSTYTVVAATAIGDGGYVTTDAIDSATGKGYALLLKLS